MSHTVEYGLSVALDLPYEDAVLLTRDKLAEEGFGVLTEIDVRETFRKKLDVEFRPYIILGACNPPLAHQALSAEIDIGLLLPCNVVVYRDEEAGHTVVTAIDPVVQLGVTGREDITPLAQEVRGRLERVLEAVEKA